MEVTSPSPRPEPWDVVIDRSDELLDVLLEQGFTVELGERIETLMRQLSAAGRITSPFEHRQRLTTSMRFWASTLSIERSELTLAPLLHDAVSGFDLPELDANEARQVLHRESKIAEHTIMGYIDGPQEFERLGTKPPSLHDYRVTNCRLAGGGLDGMHLPGELDLHGTTMIDFGLTDLRLRSLVASSTRIIGGDVRGLTLRADANFDYAVMRNLTIQDCQFKNATFSNAILGVPAASDPDGLITFGDLRATLARLGFTVGEPITLRNVTIKTADFEAAVLDGVTFDRCTLHGVDFSVAESVHGMRFINGCKLRGAQLWGAAGDRQIYVDSSSADGVEGLPAPSAAR